MNIENAGKKIDSIEVSISYRIIELFSAGLYSSPNKAFEELVCNSYDAFADQVAVYVSPDLAADDACIWVCDNGEGMDRKELKDLWMVGTSFKRVDAKRDKRRLQIGQFGIGKLATYVLANRLTYLCKKGDKYLAATMDYQLIKDNDKEKLLLDERELTATEAEQSIQQYLLTGGKSYVPFDMFGKKAQKSWTFAIMTSLKTKASEIREGRLKWVLRTALPLNPGFRLHYNGVLVESSKINKKLMKSWVLGKNDSVAESLDFANCRTTRKDHYIDFDALQGVYGRIELYEDSLVDSTKSAGLGRSHGIFLLVRDRLINIDDPLLGMEAFSHGAFNRTRMVIHADGLDNNLTSTRESIKDSVPFRQLKEYLKKKFNNEVRKHYFEEEIKRDRQRSIDYRMSQTSLTLSKRPLIVFAEKFYDNKIKSPLLIQKPNKEKRTELLSNLRDDLTTEQSLIKDIEWSILDIGEPIAKLDLESRVLKMNLMHPYIANYNDAYKSTLPLEFMAITEVLTEAYLYEQGIDEALVNFIMKRRDNTLRELSLSDREGAPAVAQMLKDSVADSTGLEDAVYRAFLSLGLEVTKIGGNGKPDGKAEAILGYSSASQSNNFSFTYDAKSTSKERIQAGTAKLSTILRHKKDYGADYAVVVAIDFEGANDDKSAIAKECKQQRVTAIRVVDLIRILLLSAPKQIGLAKLKEMFDSCYSPAEVCSWIDCVEGCTVNPGPIKEVLTTIYSLQKDDTEPPELASVRQKLITDYKTTLSKSDIRSILESLQVFVPGFISIEGEKVGIKARPDRVQDVISSTINNIPSNIQKMYLKAFSVKSKK